MPKKKKGIARKNAHAKPKKAAPKKKPVAKRPAPKATAKTPKVAPPPPDSESPAKRAAMADDGEVVEVEARMWTSGAHAEELGTLDVPSGTVMVCDPGTLFGPVAVAVPSGTYDVRVGHDGRDNFASALVAKGAKPTSWKKVGVYGVDAGMAGFFDAAVLARVDKHSFPISIYDDLICDHLDVAEEAGHAGAFCPFEESKFSSCRSGHGDGGYPVFAGTDGSGKVVAVVTTFLW